MKNPLYWFIGAIALCCLIYVGSCLYQVASISSTVPPVKVYHFKENADSLVSYIRKRVARDTLLSLHVQANGNGKERFYEIYVYQKQPKLEFDFKCDREADSSMLKLIGAHNIDNGTGGYGRDAVGINPLITRFEQIFPSLITDTH